MTADGKAIIRPRTTGEVLDDAWRLALADGPLLLALSALFSVPAAVAIALLVTRPRPDSLLLELAGPPLAALLLPLTGLGSGACQEVLRRRAEGMPVGIGSCLFAALRQGLEHVAARALVLIGALAGFFMLGMPALAVWVAAATVHPTLAGGRGRFFEALGEVFGGLPQQSGKAAAVTLLRLPLLAFAVLNLYFLSHVVLGILDAVTPLDTALTAVQLELTNPVFLAALTALAWMLLAPYAEACNYLLHVDARARSEGLDLWFRVRRAFPTAVGPTSAALFAGLLLLGGGTLVAAPLDRVRDARREVTQIRGEVAKTDPYPGGNAWERRLVDVAHSLDSRGSSTRGPYRWFYAGIEGFAARKKEGAVHVLDDLSRRLEAAEDSLTPPASGETRRSISRDEVKKLLPQSSGDAAPKRATRPEEKPKREPVRREDEAGEDGIGPRRGPGAVGPAPAGAGFSLIGWMILAGMAAAVLVLTVILLVANRPERKPATATESGARPAAPERRPAEPQAARALWREADELSRQGRFLEAVRCVYLAVLAGLHQTGLIRYEPMRTNGEYARMLRAKEADPEEVVEPFRELTGLFEQKWYGERGAAREDYAECVRLGETIRDNVG